MKHNYFKKIILRTKWSALVVSINFLFHSVITYFLMADVASMRKVVVFPETLHKIIFPVLGFELKILCFFLFFYFAFGFLEVLFRGRHNWLVPLGLFFYLHLKAILHYPQLYDDFKILAHFIPLLLKVLNPTSLLIFGLMLPAIWLLLSHPTRTPKNFFARVGVCAIFWSCLLFWPAFEFKMPVSSAPKSASGGSTHPPSLIFLSVDSLEQDLKLGKKPHTSNFSTQAIDFQNVFAPQGQTHVSLTSFMREQLPNIHGLRNFLQADAMKEPDYYVGPTLKNLKNQGYKIAVILEGQTFIDFKKNQYVDYYVSQPHGLQSYLYPNLLRSGLFWSFFNNSLGYFLLPEIKYNVEYLSTYNLKLFSQFVIDEMSKLAATGSPFVFFVHTCAFHWPGSSPYPYYKEDRHTSFPYFSYDTRYLPMEAINYTGANTYERAKVNEKMYENNFRWILDDFIEPILGAVHTLNLDDSSLVTLMSDHGEDFWVDEKFPTKRTPSHTRGPLFSSNAENIRFQVLAPKEEQRKKLLQYSARATSNTELLALLQKVIDPELAVRAQPEVPVYTEAGLWGSTFFPGQLNLFDFTQFKDSVIIDEGTHNISFRFDIVANNLEKIRSVRDSRFRFSVYLTQYGYQYTLCEKSLDPDCIKNVAADNPEKIEYYLNSLKAYMLPEVAAGEMPILNFDANRPGFLNSSVDQSSKLSNNPWYMAVKASEAFYRYRNLSEASRISLELAQMKTISEYLIVRSKNQLLDNCEAGILGDARAYLQKELNDINGVRNFLDYAYVDDRFTSQNLRVQTAINCLSVLGLEATRAEWLNEIKEASGSNDIIKFSLILLDRENRVEPLQKMSLETVKNSIPEARVFFQLLLLDIIYPNQINMLFDNPFFTVLSPKMRKPVIERSSRPPTAWADSLDEEFAIDSEYNVMETLENFFLLKLGPKIDFHKDFMVVFKSLTWPQLPRKYFNTLLWSLRNMYPDAQNPWDIEQLSMPNLDLFRLQRSYANYLIESRFCAENKVHSNACEKLAPVFRNDPLKKVWKNWLASDRSNSTKALTQLLLLDKNILKKFSTD